MSSDRTLDEVRSLFKNGEFIPAASRAKRGIEQLDRPENRAGSVTIRDVLKKAQLAALILAGRNTEAAALAPAVDLCFERAYSLYNGNELTAALADIQKLLSDKMTPENEMPLKQLLAQIHYRMGSYSESAEVYEGIYSRMTEPRRTRIWQRASGSQSGPSLERLQANLCAAFTVSGRSAEVLSMDLKLDAEGNYTGAYNLSCALIDAGDLAGAKVLLYNAIDWCRAVLEREEYSQEEIEDELALYRSQLAFILQSTGELQQAKDEYLNILKHKPTDRSLVAVISSNLASARDGEKMNLLDILKKMKVSVGEGQSLRLTQQQRRIVGMNRCLIQHELGKIEDALLDVRRLRDQFPMDVDLLLTEVALLSHEKKYEVAKERTVQFQVRLSDPSAGVSSRVELALAQIELMSGAFDNAIEILRNSGIARKPGTLATVASILEKSGKISETIEYLNSELQRSSSAELGAKLQEGLAYLYQRQQLHAEAAEVFSNLLSNDPGNVDLLGALVHSLSWVNVGEAERHALNLQALIDSGEEIDVDALESSPPPSRPGDKRLRRRLAEKSDETQAEKPKRKKKKKKRLPKNWGPDDPPPDPERWLPKSLRSSNKKRRIKRIDIGKGSQGTDVTSRKTDHLDVANTAVGSNTPTAAVVSESQRPRGAKKKSNRRHR